MELTPVRIRGKKRKASSIASSKSSSSSPAPSKSLRQFTSKPKPAKLAKAKKKVMAATPTLQGLPQELLEIVFLYSMNINLPRASPDLGRKLSSKAICMEFCMRSFFETVDHKANIRDRTITSDPALQTELLACRFYTWPFFLAYVNKAHDAYLQLRGKAWAEARVGVPDASYFDNLWPFRFTKVTYLSFAEGFQVPEKLLHGPWTADKASLLYVLVSLNGVIDWERSMAGEIAKGGMKEAIEEGNEYAVAALSVLLGVAQAITTDMIRYAVLRGDFNINVVRHLLFNAQILYPHTPKETLDLHDPSLWQWADENNEGYGVLLKDMLKQAADFSLRFYMRGESDWGRAVAFPYGGQLFDARTTFDDMTRELLTRLYRNYGRRITIRKRARRTEIDFEL